MSRSVARGRGRGRVLFIGVTAATLTILSVACQLVLGVESRSERTEIAEDASTSSASDAAATLQEDVHDAGGGCGLGRVTCGDACVDLQVNGVHCGACGHSCLDAGCARGECVPEKLVEAAYGQVAAVDAKEVFYRAASDDVPVSALIARDKQSGAERTVTNIGKWYQAVLDGPDLVISENAPTPRIRRIDRQTGAATTIYQQATSAPSFMHVAVDGDDIYWTTKSDVRHIKRDGSGYGVIKTITEGLYGATRIATSDTEVFFGVDDTPNLYSVPKNSDAGVATIRGTGNGQVTSIAIARTTSLFDQATTIFWSAGTKMHILSGSEDSVHPLDFKNVHATAVKDHYIYFYDVDFGYANRSRILRFDPIAKETLMLVSATRDGRLVVDETHVYFAHYPIVGGGGGLYRVAR